MLDQIDARLAVLRMTAPEPLAAAGVDVDVEEVLRHTGLARRAVRGGILGYTLLVAEKPATSPRRRRSPRGAEPVVSRW
jgi:hypothetical protein